MKTMFTMSVDMVEAVYREWERETGKRAHEMTPEQFSERMMKKIKASAQVIHDPQKAD